MFIFSQFTETLLFQLFSLSSAELVAILCYCNAEYEMAEWGRGS